MRAKRVHTRARSDKLTPPAPEDFVGAVRERLTYDPETGEFRFRKSGKIAGCLDKSSGYVRIRLWNVLYHGHRLAWLYVHGVWPEEEIDHRSRVRSDNRERNIRPATSRQNSHNIGLSVRNRSGVKGVCYDPARGLWRATIVIDGKWCQLGRFSTKELAQQVYERAARQSRREFYPYEENRAGSPGLGECSA